MTDQQTEHPAGPDPTYGRRALSTKGYVAVGVIPVLIAAVLYALVVWNYEETDVQGTSAPLLASSWQPGAPAGSEPVMGVLGRDDDGCPVLLTDDETLSVAWPAGWSARVSPGGTLTVYDPRDRPQVRVDQEIRATGSVVDVAGSPYAGRPCAPGSGTVVEIQSDVQVVNG